MFVQVNRSISNFPLSKFQLKALFKGNPPCKIFNYIFDQKIIVFNGQELFDHYIYNENLPIGAIFDQRIFGVNHFPSNIFKYKTSIEFSNFTHTTFSRIYCLNVGLQDNMMETTKEITQEVSAKKLICFRV